MGKVFFASKALRVKYLEIFYGGQKTIVIIVVVVIYCNYYYMLVHREKNSYIFRTT